MNWLIRQIAKITLLGKLVEKLGPKVPVIFIIISLIFFAFYIPYEYEKFLEFKIKFPNENIGLGLNILRPVVIISIFLFFIFSAFEAVRERKKQLEEEEEERKKKEAEYNAKKQEALRKLEQFKATPVAKATEAVVTKKSIGTLGGAAIGATLGGSLGIAGKFLGAMVFINGAWVLAPLGGAIGYFAAKKLAKNKKQKIEQEKIKKYGEEINNQTRENKK
jgi:positive regulator of sigma E activity